MTDLESAGSSRLRLRSPGELLAAVPHLLGFVPSGSLVLAAVHDTGGRPRLGAVVRVDLPPPEHVADVVGACARRLGRREPLEIVAVVVGPASPDGRDDAGGDPPRADVVEAVEAFFALARVPVPTRLWTPRIAAGAPWRCYPPCDCSGTLPDPSSSPAAAATTLQGQVTFASRAEVEQLVRPDPGAGSARRRALVDRAHDAAALDRELAGPAAARRDHAAVAAAARALERGEALGDVEVARLAAALTDPRVRDACLAWSAPETGPDPGPDAGPDAGTADGAVSAAAAEALWTLLTRAVPAPEVAEPATLLACAVLLRGGGALVGAALERAAAADPDHTLSRLVAGLLDRGIGPDESRAWMRGAGAEAGRLLRDGRPAPGDRGGLRSA